ncbi:YchJ family protein [Marinobacter sp. VGCF2001]|uniref:YchJ family protein n=1 Tax=Marinobacter sp. VGCF2001 TaxID=3417189 RepID=UPI003CF5F0C1
MSEFDPDNQCYCGSGKPYNACCQPFHGGAAAPTPETLMRSRFSAFVLADSDYLLATWHPDTRPPALDLSGSPAWVSLQVLSASARGDAGKVHFRALYRAGSGWGYLEENSDFSRIEGRWLYREGETTEGMLKPGRNDRCPCGSGKKYKACCL